jgi:hypothetical protein
VNPFRISCTTCQARLKIADPAAVGQILSCPKCGSLVQATPPAGWSPDEADASASSSGLGSSMVVPLLGSRPETAGANHGLAATAKQSDLVARPSPEPPPLPTHTAATARWFWPALSAATVLSIAVAALIIYLDRKNRPVQVASSEGTSQQVALATEKPAEEKTPLESRPKVAKQADVSAPSKPAENSVEKSPPKAAAQLNPSQPASAPADANPKPPAAVQAAATAPSPPNTAKPAEPPPAVVTVEKPPTSPSNDAAAAAAEPPQSPVAPHPSPDEPPAGRVARPSVERIPPKDVDVQARLASHIAGVDYKQVPLVRLLAELSQWSTIPITIDADALHELSIAADVPVTMSVKDTTIAGVLDEVLRPLRLGYRVVGHQLLITWPQTDALRQVRYNVVDLSGDTPEGKTQFAALVKAMIEPASWKDTDPVGNGLHAVPGPSGASVVPAAGTSRWSDGALVVEQSESAHTQMIIFCEKLRLARGLPLRSKLDPARFGLEPRTSAAKAMLSRPVTLNFGRPEPLASVLAYLQTSTQAIFLVDQVALAEQRTSVDMRGVLVANGQPLDQALTTLLEPMDLAWRVVGERTIEITTPEAAAKHADVEFYRVTELLGGDGKGEQLIARLQRELSSASASDPVRAAATIRFDAPSRALIVRAPQIVQLRAAALLSTWRVARQ